jgi:hypothetical protein
VNASDRGSELWALSAVTCKPATEVRDYLVKFIDNVDGIFIVKSAEEAVWQMDGGGWGVIFRGVMDVLPVW